MELIEAAMQHETHHHADSDFVPVDPGGKQATLMDTPLRTYFEAATKYEASDLHLRADAVPRLRIAGKLKSLETQPLENEVFSQWISESLTPAQRKFFAEHGSIDLAVDLSENARFRINIFRTRGRTALVARRIGAEIFSAEQLHLPKVVLEIAKQRLGLVLVCGITGSGKSTTLASIVEQINQTRACHIVTVEDPIEFLFKDNKATISQREVGIDVPDFPTALRSMVREDPDVMLVGEMRDRVTFEAALRAAETGHLVFGTIHASSTSQAFGRIYDLFPADERSPIRNMLAYQLVAVIYQKLLPTIREDVTLVPAVEVLLQSPNTRRYILDGREHELDNVIKNNREAGMQTFADSLVSLVENEFIHPHEAQSAGTSPDEIKMRLRGIRTE